MATATTTLPADKFDTSTIFVRPDPLPTRAPLDKLAVLPGFNTRVKDDDYRERVATIAESIASHGFFDDKPFAVVMLPNDDTIYIFDGEHRFDGAKQAGLDGVEFPDGLPIAWAKDEATVKDLTIHLAHGNNGERLNMVELAAVVRRMQGLNMDKDEIATALGRTTRHVDNLFVLAAASNAVKKAVATGQIAGAEAVKLLRKDKATAGAKIAEAVKAAAEKGKAKATPKTMNADAATAAPKGPKTKTVPFTLNFPVGKTMGDVLKEMAKSIREVVETGEGDTVAAEALLRFSVTTIDRDAEAAAKKAAEEKAAAAAQRETERAEKAAKKLAEKAAADADKAAKTKATEDALKAAAKGTDKKATGGKKGEAKDPSFVDALKAAGKPIPDGKVKPARGGKAAQAAGKPAEADSGASGTPGTPEAGIAPSGPETPPAGAMTDESMGGL